MSEAGRRAPILVLGLGNSLLTDDGAGLEVLRLLRETDVARDPRVELVDGGTQGVALTGLFEEREAVLLLDAEQRGGDAGTVYVSDAERVAAGARGQTAHEGNAAELLAVVRLLGLQTGPLSLIGIEPGEVRTGYGLTPTVRSALPRAVQAARAALRRLTTELDGTEATSCTS